MASENRQPPSPSPNIPSFPSSSLFKDISNFKTPKPKTSSSRIFQSSTPRFFTASKQMQTPSSSLSSSTARRRRRPSSPAVSKLRQFELEVAQSSRKEEVKKERSMKSLAKSLTAWLNFLFENPRSCGCDDGGAGAGDGGDASGGGGGRSGGKRENVFGGGVGGGWRLPKRQREEGGGFMEEDRREVLSSKKRFGFLWKSLREVCSFDDLEVRMREYLSLEGCMEVFTAMSQVAKNIDEGRLKMKAHCPLVTDVGMREKAIKVLMSYNPVWLQIGLYIIFGGDSLLPKEDSNREDDIAFLKMVIEKQLFSHAGLAKTYAYNKLVDGMYRPGYFETLGNVILKRFLMLVLILDRGKCQSSLPIKYGIDGLDGGSPLLFNVKSNIKSSRQLINDFLSSEVMHGEGNLLAHLVIVGYKVSYQQNPLIEYDFRITDLFQDIQDGVRLCRAIQLLQHDSSILLKVVLPSDTNKKKLANCRTALEYLKQAGVSLLDDDGTMIVGEDVANGDKELVLSLLWNVFVHLQLPRLVTKKILSEEIPKISKAHTELMDVDTSNHLDMLLHWMKAICGNYDVKMENLSSLVDGKAMWCLLDFYFRKELHCSCSIKDLNDTNEGSIVSMRDTSDAVHNFVLSQKLTTLLGNFPEVLQICDILEYNGACNDRSVIILLVFLSSQLLVKKSKDKLNFHKLMGCQCQNPERKRWSMSSETTWHKERERSAGDGGMKFKAVQAWWQEMDKRNSDGVNQSDALAMLPPSAENCSFEIWKVNAAEIIQSHVRRVVERKKYLKMKQSALNIQHAWKQFLVSEYWQTRFSAATMIQRHVRGWILRRRFLRQKQAALQIQSVLRSMRYLKAFHEYSIATKSAIIVQSHVRGFIARRDACRHRNCILLVQSYCRCWLARTSFLRKKEAALRIQNAFRVKMCRYAFHRNRNAATEIQRLIRGKISRNRLLGSSSLRVAASGNTTLTSSYRSYSTELSIVLDAIVKLQRWWKSVLEYKLRKEAAVIIQYYIRGFLCRQKAIKERHHAITIQAHWKGYLARKHAKEQLVDLRLRIQQSAATVEDRMRIMNRLIAALKELKGMKIVSGILHNCATLNMATTHSQKCCERLVEEGAIEILLYQITAVTRSIPDQEVMKHCLSTLRNLSRHAHLADVLVAHQGSIETILREFLRNKEEGYFIACELLKNLCTRPTSVEATRGLSSMLKRLQALVDDLTRKANHEKRKPRAAAAQDTTERRLREATELLNLITCGLHSSWP
ncbi:abnormal spindle-like microcephaly-associated protein homolog [Chenopodium quinoa]|uniref:abnormal spindle-like microcephaly-associated protein homolog n=1 Tax=Chenopodium quinoa TaxID=63459 RepID=UPI000B76DCC4|nr:abnormal spindle-like microcephaly-associated protein homolog [Chenopodium quinoa]